MSGKASDLLNLNWKTAAVLGAVVIIIVVLVLIVPGCTEAEIIGIKIKKCPSKIEDNSNEGNLRSGLASDVEVTVTPRLPSILTAFNQSSSIALPPSIEKSYLVGNWNFTGISNDLKISGLMVFDDTGRYKISTDVEDTKLEDFGVYQLGLVNKNQGQLTLTSDSSNITNTYRLKDIGADSFTAENDKETLEFVYQGSR